MRPHWSGLNVASVRMGTGGKGFSKRSRQPARSAWALPVNSRTIGSSIPRSQMRPRTTPLMRLSISPRITLSWIRQAMPMSLPWTNGNEKSAVILKCW